MADQGSSPMVDGHSGTSVLNSVHYKHVAGEGTPSWCPAHPTAHGQPLACVVITLGEPPAQQNPAVTLWVTPSPYRHPRESWLWRPEGRG